MHVVQRGNDRMACFRQEGDYLVYLALLRESAPKFGCDIHAFCLMTNHVHLLLTPSTDEGCSALIKHVSQRYVRYFNREHSRTGTLWEGRFRSCLTESARYVLACYRYIEMNPVRAGMVAHPAGYPWSSFAINARMRSDTLISPHAEFAAPLLVAIRDATNGGYPLVSRSFQLRLADLFGV